ncbi:hypothetical protein QFC22_000315 [Naganishia vaughanmartiniae]|uniref:Uncharacterized protein n=1 Tax=Naganishia vaughanmartiniae TaxID=1424756 RepID=A0ACC2XPR6_9TREE|nr:hypothetical protein QFC22_000315 [Naganishia vaughanmartiniae]
MSEPKERNADESEEGSDVGDAGTQGGTIRKPKTTIACDRCRLKKRKVRVLLDPPSCDGHKPSCRHCRLAEAHCVYPEKPRQRGPVAGYAKEMEKRLAWLEGFIVFVDQKLQSASQEVPIRLNLRHLTQTYIDHSIDRDPEEWSSLRNSFQQCFGDLTNAAREGPESLKSSRGRKRSHSQIIDRPPSLQSTSDFGHNLPPASLDTPKRHDESGQGDFVPADTDAMAIHVSAQSSTLPQSSFGAMQDKIHPPVADFQPQDLLALSQPYYHPSARLTSNDFGPPISSAQTSSHLANRMISPNGFGPTLDGYNIQPAHTVNTHSLNDFREGQMSGSARRGSQFLEHTPFNPDASTFSTSISRQAFDLDYSSNLRRELDIDDVLRIGENAVDSLQIQLPPPELQSYLIGLYLDHTETQLPFVQAEPLRAYITSITSKSLKRQETSPNRLLILAICAYASCCSSAVSHALAPNNGISLSNITSDSLGEIWAGEARNFLLTSSLRRRSDIETVHGIMILVMRDMGCAQYFQAWLWLGIAVRISQDIGLHVSSNQESTGPEDDVLRKTWTALGLLDVMLSLQLNRPTAVDFSVYGLRRTDTSRTTNTAHSTIDEAILQLCGYLSDVRKMYASSILDVSSLGEIRDGLQHWKRRIPSEFQLHYDEEQSPLVVTMHMIYHVAMVLLHRPFQNSTGVDTVRPIATATASFKMLLDSIRLPVLGDTMLHFSPILIYPCYTVGIALITSERRSNRMEQSMSSSASLTRQASLSACLETLDTMSATWPLARRCHMILRKLSVDDDHSIGAIVDPANLASRSQQQPQNLANAADDLSAFTLLGGTLPTIGYSSNSEQDDLLTLLMTNDWTVDNAARSGEGDMHENMVARHSNMM